MLDVVRFFEFLSGIKLAFVEHSIVPEQLRCEIK